MIEKLFILALLIVLTVGCGCEATVAKTKMEDIPPPIKIEEGTEEESEVNVADISNSSSAELE